MEKKKGEFKAGQVSIVTPVYNGESYLSQMLESILCQTYEYVEMILVDDGSTDRTVAVAKNYCGRFAAKGYTYRIIEAEHKNASAAINSGLPYVTGEYLIWPDSDDVLESDSIKKRVDFLQKHPQYQAVRSTAYYFNPKTGERTRREEQNGDLTEEYLFWSVMESKTYVCCGCYMLRTEAFFEIYADRHIPEYNVGQNFQMLLPFLFHYKCPTMQEELYGVCCREGSHSRTKLTQAEEEKKYLDYENLIDDIAAICHITDPESKKRIKCWKHKRRYQISLKYGKKRLAAFALCKWYRCEGIGFKQASKKLIKIFLGKK